MELIVQIKNEMTPNEIAEAEELAQSYFADDGLS
jgi:hypothetical protein